MVNSAFNDYVAALEAVFDATVLNGNDDQLFASGYLRGHVDLVVAQLELNAQADAAAVMPAVMASVEAARHELSPADFQHIQDFLAQLAAVKHP
ncbi:YfcL family protein [Pseudidiomarina mangrovi]|uniref:YfcL family protein n=1 Tax=Pseudidiomarina mangrovi TaxID=2487133 RepID=UPI000FCC16A1|nr:YfcL family protein [Pseudidiomarina mangrovi]